MTGRGDGHPGTCGLCRGRLNGTARPPRGRTRWRCTSCGASSTKPRPDVSRRAELDSFLAWLLGPLGQAAASGSSARTFRLSGNQTLPSWVRSGQRWWYTHERLRRAYRLLAKLAQREHLFAYLAPEHDGLNIASTTNRIEGGINAGLRDLLRRHRGMPEHHQCRAVEWWLHAHAIAAPPPASLIRPHLDKPARRPPPSKTNRSALLATTPDSTPKKEGLWHRRGWAGLS